MAVIVHSLDLVLYFIDTTTGLGIYTPPIRLYKNGDRLLFQRRGTGQVLVVGCGREDFDLTVELSGYEYTTLRVQYDKLNNQMPMLQMHMIPTPTGTNTQLLTFSGKLPGITALDAIPITGSCCLLEQYNAKLKQMTVFSQYPLSLENLHYAVRNSTNTGYQPFRVLNEVKTKPKIYAVDRPLVLDGNSLPIVPMNIGQVKNDGSYLLRAQDESLQAEWILRWQVGEEEFFKILNFHETNNFTL
ncbi:MAG: hypothetical protein RR573_02755 [Oscillospiraceae bacterium]